MTTGRRIVNWGRRTRKKKKKKIKKNTNHVSLSLSHCFKTNSGVSGFRLTYGRRGGGGGVMGGGARGETTGIVEVAR